MNPEVREAADRVWLVLDAVAAMNPNVPFKKGVQMAQETYAQIDWARANGHSTPPDAAPSSRKALDDVNIMDPVDLGTWLAGEKIVIDFLEERKTINAIKEARALTKAGLYEAKRAVEYLQSNWVHLTGKPMP